jgi:hypothetical protein
MANNYHQKNAKTDEAFHNILVQWLGYNGNTTTLFCKLYIFGYMSASHLKLLQLQLLSDTEYENYSFSVDSIKLTTE